MVLTQDFKTGNILSVTIVVTFSHTGSGGYHEVIV
jgi:hypothetical protein